MKRIVFALGALVLAASALSSTTAQEPDGKAIYEKNCKKCHGPSGTPTKESKEEYPKVVTFNDPKFAASHSVDSIVKILMHGKGEDMKPFKLKLTAPEMAAVAKYVGGLSIKSDP